MINKPYKRTCRQLLDGSYKNSGMAAYLLHPDFAQDPQHYVRAFSLIQKDLLAIFEYVDPCDQNLNTVSFRIHELLMRTCIEFEANCTAILKENKYSNTKNWNLTDYCKINKSHRLSSYKVRFPVWTGQQNIYHPFKNWDTSHSLVWYQAYNKSKHDRHTNFSIATLNTLLEAISGLIIVLSAQFCDEDFSPNDKGISIGSSYSYGTDDEMDTAIGGYLRVSFPEDWPEKERYYPASTKLSQIQIDRYDYDAVI